MYGRYHLPDETGQADYYRYHTRTGEAPLFVHRASEITSIYTSRFSRINKKPLYDRLVSFFTIIVIMGYSFFLYRSPRRPRTDTPWTPRNDGGEQCLHSAYDACKPTVHGTRFNAYTFFLSYEIIIIIICIYYAVQCFLL